MEALNGLGTALDQSKLLDAVAADVAAAFGMLIALVTVIDDEWQRWPGAVGLPPEAEICRMDRRETSVCGHVVTTQEIIVVEDI